MKISEQFYSLQLEGVSSGIPAYFIRFPNCNMCCGGHNGKLLKEGKATWYCDTEPIWRRSTEYTPEQVVDKIQAAGQLERVLEGRTRIIFTGGETLLPQNQRSMDEFRTYCDKRFEGNSIYDEIETNGTLLMYPRTYRRTKQINCSPKLANSGMPAKVRINESAIKQVIAHSNGWFKYVVSSEPDIAEIERDYINPFDIPQDKVILMPGVDKLADLSERTRFVYEMSKKYGYRACTRGQVLAWGKTVGV